VADCVTLQFGTTVVPLALAAGVSTDELDYNHGVRT
jgi:hypothetical protein